MPALLYAIIYACVCVFLIACIVRAVRYAKAPIHLRWELYPVPHEEPERVKHGGSYFESVDWWTKPRHFNLTGELKSMVPEMLFLKGLFEFNRKLWFRSFPFHFGLYLMIGSIGLLFVSALLAFPAPILVFAYTATGAAGMVLAIIGAAALLARRLTDRKLKSYTAPADIFNLLFFIVALGTVFAGSLFREPGSPGAYVFMRGLLSFDTSVEMPGLLTAGLILAAILVAYIPLTHMSHFIAKYFTYHSVRWDDQPNTRGGEIEKKLAEYLTYRPTWAAAHIAGDGTKTWVDVATTNPTQKAVRP